MGIFGNDEEQQARIGALDNHVEAPISVRLEGEVRS
jgi:hypothetical protein